MEYFAWTFTRIHLGAGREWRRRKVVRESIGARAWDDQEFVHRWSEGSPVAVESVGNWYWVVDEIEAGGGSRSWSMRGWPN